MAKDKDYRKLINTARWHKLRAEILNLHPLCQRCLEHDRVTTATEVHHKRPVEEAMNPGEKRRLMFNPNNLQALCHDCHSYIHTHEIGRGRRLTKERTAKQVKEIIKTIFGDAIETQTDANETPRG